MTERATERAVVRATPERCYAVATDFERYPEWVAAVKSVVVEERDERGRGVRVQFRAASFGRSVSYTLRYDHSGAPGRLEWHQVAGTLTSRIDGTYEFAALGDATDVTYRLAVDLRLPIPGFVKRRAESLVIAAALRELRIRVESDAPAGAGEGR